MWTSTSTRSNGSLALHKGAHRTVKPVPCISTQSPVSESWEKGSTEARIIESFASVSENFHRHFPFTTSERLQAHLIPKLQNQNISHFQV